MCVCGLDSSNIAYIYPFRVILSADISTVLTLSSLGRMPCGPIMAPEKKDFGEKEFGFHG